MVNLSLGPLKGLTKPTPTNIAIWGVVAFGGYLAYQFLTTDQGLKVTPPEKGENGVDVNPDVAKVVFDVIPPSVPPNGFITIKGSFFDLNNRKQVAPKAFYYVFDDQNFYGRKLVMQGSLGDMVSDFSKTVQVPVLNRGSFSVVVKDEPFSPRDLFPQDASQGIMGDQSRGRGPQDPISVVDHGDISFG